MATQKPQTKQPELIETSSKDDKKSSKYEERNLCNGCMELGFVSNTLEAVCRKGETILRVVFNGRPIFICKDKKCKRC